jgi:HlyD family secretion protein
MKRSLTWTLRIGSLLLVAAGVAWLLRPRAMPVDVALVVRGPFEATVTADGKTRVRDLFVVAAPVDGELQRISLKNGDAVAVSAVVAEILPVAPRPLDVRSRAEADAAVTSARAAVERAAATQKEAAGAVTHAESSYETTQQLAAKQVIAPIDLDHAGHELEIRRQALQSSRAALAVARAELVRAEAAAGISTNAAGRAVTQVRSPIAGRVLRVLRESEGTVAAGTPLLEVGNTSNIEIAAEFLTTDAMAVRPGASATIQDWGEGQPIAARVRRVEPAAFTKVSPLGLEEQRVTVVLDVVDPRSVSFGHDYHVNVAVVVWRADTALAIPSTALFRIGADWGVFVVRNGSAHLTRVQTGRSDATRTVIERGLSEGDAVVVQPSDALTDGARVAVLDGTRSATR